MSTIDRLRAIKSQMSGTESAGTPRQRLRRQAPARREVEFDYNGRRVQRGRALGPSSLHVPSSYNDADAYRGDAGGDDGDSYDAPGSGQYVAEVRA